MGNKESTKITVTDYNHEEWKYISAHRSIAEIVLSPKGKGQA